MRRPNRLTDLDVRGTPSPARHTFVNAGSGRRSYDGQSVMRGGVVPQAVFISYSSKHRALTEELAAHLEGCGLDVWWDRALVARGPFDVQIKEQLRTAGCIVVLWTDGAVASEWVKIEAEYALQQDKLVNVRVRRVRDGLWAVHDHIFRWPTHLRWRAQPGPDGQDVQGIGPVGCKCDLGSGCARTEMARNRCKQLSHLSLSRRSATGAPRSIGRNTPVAAAKSSAPCHRERSNRRRQYRWYRRLDIIRGLPRWSKVLGTSGYR